MIGDSYKLSIGPLLCLPVMLGVSRTQIIWDKRIKMRIDITILLLMYLELDIVIFNLICPSIVAANFSTIEESQFKLIEYYLWSCANCWTGEVARI